VAGQGGQWPNRTWANKHWSDQRDMTHHDFMRVIRKSSIPAKGKVTTSQWARERAAQRGEPPPPPHDSRNMLHWVGPTPDDLIANMSPAKKQWAYESLERQMSEDNPLDNHEAFARWIDRLRDRRHNPANWPHGTSKHSGTGELISERSRTGARRVKDGVYEGRERVDLSKLRGR
jgi:hypothetical protein